MALNERQKIFVQKLLMGYTATDAAIEAGYSKRSAAQTAHRMLTLPEVQAYRRELEKKLFDEMGISKEWIGRRLVEVVERAMSAEPHLKWNPQTRRKEPDGSWVFDGRTAVTALHELAIQMGYAEEEEAPKDQGQSFEDWLAKQNEQSRL